MPSPSTRKIQPMLRRLAWLGVVLLPLVIFAGPPDAAYPQWWLDYGLAGAQPPASGNTTAYNDWIQINYAPANLGQLKNFAVQADNYLQSWVGNNTNITSNLVISDLGNIANMTANFSTNATLNYQPINLGQLKNVAQPFYDLLNDIGYNTTAQLNYLMYGSPTAGTWTYSYPWNPSTPYAENYAPVNLGQLKLVFSFDLSDSLTALGGTPDYYQLLEESMLGGNPNSLSSGLPDTDGTGGSDGVDVFPLDPAFSAVPTLGGNDTSVPVITLTAPTDAALVN